MMTEERLTGAEIRERVDGLVPSLAGRAGEAEALRRLPQATIDDVEALDLFRMIVPTSLGGHGLDFDTLCQSTRAMAHGCVSSAWATSFLIMHNWLMSRFPAEALAEFFDGGRPWVLAAAPTAPTGTYERRGHDFVLTGRWEWATAVHHADWVIVHAVNPDVDFSNRFFAVPVVEVDIDDVWHTSGMRGTGSDVVRLDRCVVPGHRSLPALEYVESRTDLEGDGLSGLPMAPVLALMAAAPAIGAAEAAVDLYRERVERRVLAYSLGDKAREQPAAQMRLGAALADVASARLTWDAAISELADAVGADAISMERRAALRLAASDVVRRARAVINDVADGSGASAYYDESPFQRLQRDVEMLKGHVIFDWDRTTELAGKVALGIQPGLADMI